MTPLFGSGPPGQSTCFQCIIEPPNQGLCYSGFHLHWKKKKQKQKQNQWKHLPWNAKPVWVILAMDLRGFQHKWNPAISCVSALEASLHFFHKGHACHFPCSNPLPLSNDSCSQNPNRGEGKSTYQRISAAVYGKLCHTLDSAMGRHCKGKVGRTTTQYLLLWDWLENSCRHKQVVHSSINFRHSYFFLVPTVSDQMNLDKATQEVIPAYPTLNISKLQGKLTSVEYSINLSLAASHSVQRSWNKTHEPHSA